MAAYRLGFAKEDCPDAAPKRLWETFPNLSPRD